jgi:hypothetical protein
MFTDVVDMKQFYVCWIDRSNIFVMTIIIVLIDSITTGLLSVSIYSYISPNYHYHHYITHAFLLLVDHFAQID